MVDFDMPVLTPASDWLISSHRNIFSRRSPNVFNVYSSLLIGIQ